MENLIRREADPIYEALREAVQKPIKRCLWTEADTIEFEPYVLPVSYGDGRALFGIGTLQQRPRYWVIRGDSSWESGTDYPGTDSDDDSPQDIGEFTEDILTDLEEAFGRAWCGYCGQSLSMYSVDDPPPCNKEGCEGKEELEAGCDWPCVDGNGGCHWFRLDWPPGFAVTRSPHYHETILAICASAEVA